jgi:hypothetical protein
LLTRDRFIASRCVIGGGATGPRRRLSASRRFGVGLPFAGVYDRLATATSSSKASSVTSSAGLAAARRRGSFTTPG